MRSLARDFSSSARGARERRVETVFLERLPEPHRLHDMGVHVGAVGKRPMP